MYFKIQVTPEAKREVITQTPLGGFKIQVREKAQANLANKRALAALAEHLKTDPRCLRVITGHHQPHKIVLWTKK